MSKTTEPEIRIKESIVDRLLEISAESSTALNGIIQLINDMTVNVLTAEPEPAYTGGGGVRHQDTNSLQLYRLN